MFEARTSDKLDELRISMRTFFKLLNAAATATTAVFRLHHAGIKHHSTLKSVTSMNGKPSTVRGTGLKKGEQNAVFTFMSFSNTWFSFLVTKKATYPMGFSLFFI